jgi:hypothetical protein
MITYKVIYEVYLILEDCHKVLKKIATERISRGRPKLLVGKSYDF